uniref:Uncharacterized protein n=1 Tax=uncultured marine virus TaxID=186617 RepID=A0A0F7L9E1_9VIRU|nr:hypothetical protein [uncultured marine virus]
MTFSLTGQCRSTGTSSLLCASPNSRHLNSRLRWRSCAPRGVGPRPPRGTDCRRRWLRA